MGTHKKRKKGKILPKHRLPRITNTSLQSEMIEKGIIGDNCILVQNHEEKMSEVLLDFAKPLLKDTHDNRLTKHIISFCVLVWNLSLLSETEQEKMTSDMVEKLGGDDPVARDSYGNMIRILLDRKRLYFADNKRNIVSHVFGIKNGQPWLDVASTII